jgi:NAD(P)H-nitrite reductase large subunit
VTVGLVAPAREMARVAGADLCGVPAAYLPGPVSTKLKVAGVDLYCSGEIEGPDEVIALDTRAGYYRREVYDGDELIGRIVLGEPPAAEAAADPIVCACNGITRSAIQACSSYEEVVRLTRAGTGCGGCKPKVLALLDEAAEVGFQAVQAEGPKAIEVVMRGPVEVGGAGRQQPALARGGV